MLCVQCHGEDGDATSYANIVPAAGIARRYPPAVIASLSGSFSGRTLHGRERIDVAAYMATLTGVKGFSDPGWVSSPYLVEKKSQRLAEYRVLDARPRAAYTAAHIPNVVHAREPCSTTPVTRNWLVCQRISPSTVVIVYDEEGGPSAACLWWPIRQAGH